MKGPFRFGSPKQQRLSMQYGYAARPSLWHDIKSQSHLIIAGVGTVALLGVAGGALWFAMPSGERQAFADPKPAQTTELASVAKPAIVAGKPQAADVAAIPAKTPPSTLSKTASAEVAKPVVAASGVKAPRPIDEEAKSAVVATARDAEPEQGDTDQELAYANSSDKGDAGQAAEKLAHPDGAETAAIPTPRPKTPAKQANTEKAEAETDGKSGQILRGVTMRSGPKKGASAIGTIPAKTSVEVLSCNQWCQVIYKGKRGWIYKSFVRTGG
ncbi:SH3 domain-containing protein [Mesorhizobium sp. BE184]|uniref:SH3 domain-containing protein n=1 Tax=Mesorhizobium sp. BE184 TaxID=2817714 RepID=UPI00285FA6FF|nr:SH3 domain-containing protein [Mesorhizobium sp. BE184]MDR7033078.1 hypothetical protein [Mesorhizobium sp. BE184]